VACAKALKRFDGEVYLVDRTNHHLFQPLLYQVATAGLSGSDIAQPIRSILRGQRNLRVHMAEVAQIDLAAKVVTFAFRQTKLEFDYLVIALGVRTNYFGREAWARHAMGLKKLNDAYAIRYRLLGAFERAETLANDPNERRKQLTTVVIGGGPTGVEMAGACAELGRRALRPEFKLANLAQTRVVLIDAGPRVLGTFDPSLSERARQDLIRAGVEVKLSTPVEDIGDGYVVAGGERIEAATVVWAAGVVAPEITRSLESQGAKLDRSGRIEVNADGSLPGMPEIFAVGDVAKLSDAKGVAVPGLAQGALQLGRHTGRVIMADVKGTRQSVPGFVYVDKGTMATIGRSSAVADLRGWRTGGVVAWALWLAVHLLFLIDLRSKITVLIKWTAAYVFYRPTSRVINAAE
jgi:NADH dehydrogenase